MDLAIVRRMGTGFIVPTALQSPIPVRIGGHDETIAHPTRLATVRLSRRNVPVDLERKMLV
jgi:hypothetical protein